MNTPQTPSPPIADPKLSVFICYSRKRREFAVRLQAALERNGMDVWIDLDDILPTETWSEVVERGIEQADAFLFVTSPESVASKVCLRELAHAVSMDKRLVPLMLAEAAPVPESLASIHWVDFTRETDFEASIQRLVWVLTTDLEWLRTHTRLLTQALAWDRGGRRRSKLIWGSTLREGRRWLEAAREDSQPTELHRRFIEASSCFVRRIIVIGSVSAILIVTTVSGLILYTQASREARLVTELTETVHSSDADIQLATLLGVEAVRRAGDIQWPWRTSSYMVELRKKALDSLRDRVSKSARRLAEWRLPDGDWPDAASFNPEGDILAVLAEESLWLWRWDSSEPAARFPLRPGVTAMTFLPDGARVAAGGSGVPISILEVENQVEALRADGRPGRLPAPRKIDDAPEDSENALIGLAACSDATGGRYLAAAFQSAFLVWNIDARSAPPVEIPRVSEYLYSWSVSSDCRSLATVAFAPEYAKRQAWAFGRKDDPNIFLALRDRPGGRPDTSLDPLKTPSTFRLQENVQINRGNVVAVALSRDGGLYATALTNLDETAGGANAATIIVGDFWSGEEKSRLRFQANVEGLAFNRDNRLATAAQDGTVQVWEVNLGESKAAGTESLLKEACRLAERNLTPEEWATHLAGKGPRKTCPEFPLERAEPGFSLRLR